MVKKMVNWQAASDMLLAIRNKDEKRLEDIVMSGAADCDQQFVCGGVMKPAVLLCIERRCYDLAERLLKLGCSINQGDSDGSTPLHAAVRFGDVHCVRLLLTHGADPNRLSCSSVNHTGVSPMHVAVGIGKIEIVRMLLSYGGDPNKPDADGGLTPLFHASLSRRPDDKREVMQLLLAAGAKIPWPRSICITSDFCEDPCLADVLSAAASLGPMSLKKWCRCAIVKRVDVRNAILPRVPKSMLSFLKFESLE